MLDKVATKPIDFVRAVANENGIKSHRLLNPTNKFLANLRAEAIKRIFERWPDIEHDELKVMFDLSDSRLYKIKGKADKKIHHSESEVMAFADAFFKKKGVSFNFVVQIKMIQELRHVAIGEILENYPTFAISGIARIFNMDHTSVLHIRDKRNASERAKCSGN